MSYSPKLNLATRLCPESKGGLLICGLNWGGEPLTEREEERNEEKSFFSDTRYNNYPYRNRLLRWFDLFGHPLATSAAKAGAFERSISQTNWWSDQSPNARGVDIIQKCVDQRDNFFFHLAEIQPRLILFLSVKLLEALNHPQCIEQARSNLGREKSGATTLTKEVVVRDKSLKQFQVGFQEFEFCNVIALPHPTGSVGLSDDYIAAFRPEIDSILRQFIVGEGDASR